MHKRNGNFKLAGEIIYQLSRGGMVRAVSAAGGVSVSMLAALGLALISPIASVSAVDELPSGALIDLNSTKPVQSEVTLTMDASNENGSLNASAAELNPDAAADVVMRTATVGLANTDGYTVKIKAADSALTGTTSNTIPSVTTSKRLGQMVNEWGWTGSVGDTSVGCEPSAVFKRMTTEDQQLGSGGAIGETKQQKKVTMCFGARVDGSKAAGVYSNTITLSVVAVPGRVATFDGITTMQAMTADICRRAEINDTTQLEDVRDRVDGVAGTGTKYWVTKLLDGNCWMSQNLAFNITTTNVTAATSDVATNWTSSSSYPPTKTYDVNVDGLKFDGYSHTTTFSWNLGDYVIVNPTVAKPCSSKVGLSECTDQFVAIGDRKASIDPNFYKNNGTTYTNTEYDAHYLAGNYYEWNTATAGTGVLASNNTAASASICPKNWKLPYSGNVGIGATNGGFNYMLRQYGISGNATGTSGTNQLGYNLALSPLFFVRNGEITPLNGPRISSVGSMTAFFSSIPDTSNTNSAPIWYNGNFQADNYHGGSASASSYVGRSVRCLVPTS